METYYRRRMEGVCTRCGGRDERTDAGRCFCNACTAAEKEKRAARMEDPDYRTHEQNRQRAYRHEAGRLWARIGLCTRCGKNFAAPGSLNCENCLEYMRQYNRKRYRERSARV